MSDVEVQESGRFADLALASIHREYPNHLSHTLGSATDVRAPHALTPAFYGSFDWHSAVHGHWSLVRLLRRNPEASFAARARAALAKSFTPENLDAERDYLCAPGREGFERPYGLAWLLQLCAELREWPATPAEWKEAFTPLEVVAVMRLREWLPRLSKPIRSGEHSQTAFAMSLALDWARAAGDRSFGRLIAQRALDFYGTDIAAPVAYEPSGHDFLSPILGEADLMRRVFDPREFHGWLQRFLPEPDNPAGRAWLTPLVPSDRSDGKLAHLDGLNLSRAWMLEGIAVSLTDDASMAAPLVAAAQRHRAAGLAAVTGEHYAGGHWLASFAVYLVTRRGLTRSREAGAPEKSRPARGR
jgi:hypothetical protein